ncbi:Crossover junction endonuclease mus81 [Dispira simplex]|nr:Crossover junction endonuclease mus81 [Dispira simplex]
MPPTTTTSEGNSVPCANPLFVQWVTQWMLEARARKSKLQFVYSKAIDSLVSHPKVLQTAQEAIRLRGIGPALVTRLEKRLSQHYQETGQIPSASSSQGPRQPSGANDNSITTDNPREETNPSGSSGGTRAKRIPTYVPRYRSGSFAILIALHLLTLRTRYLNPDLRSATLDSMEQAEYESSSETSSTLPEVWIDKNDIATFAQPFSEATFNMAAYGRQYSAWNTMKTLVEKELVYRLGMAAQYALSIEGMQLAAKLFQITQQRETRLEQILEELQINADGTPREYSNLVLQRRHHSDSVLPCSGVADTGAAPLVGTLSIGRPSLSTHLQRPPPIPRSNADLQRSVRVQLAGTTTVVTPIVHQTTSYDLILVVDTREIRSKTDRDYLRVELERRGVPVVVRSLEVGDMVWVARPHGSFSADDELFLGHIVERKRMDDLIASIKDGRYKEQKNRLRACGADHVTYLVEGNSADEERHMGPNAIQTVISETQTNHGFFVKRTGSMEQTIDYLALMTRALVDFFSAKSLYQIPADLVHRDSYAKLKGTLQQLHPSRSWCINYAALCRIASKSGDLVLSDLFTRMLMSAKGMTAEKALYLVRRYPTPARFLDSLSAESSQQRREEILQDNRNSSQLARRKIGPALATKLADTWFADVYPE